MDVILGNDSLALECSVYLQVLEIGFGRSLADKFELVAVRVEKIPLKKAVEMVLNNEIPDSKTQTAVLKTAMLFDKLKSNGAVK